MFHENTITLLASGIKNEDAITALLALQSEEVDLAVVLNTNLKEKHMQTLLERYIGVDEFLTRSGRTAVLLASRLNLSKAQLWQILRSDNKRLIQSLLTRYEDPSIELDTYMLDYMLAADWFTPQHAKILSNSPQMRARKEEESIRKIYEDHVGKNDFADTELGEVQILSREIAAVRDASEYGFFFDDQPLDKRWVNVARYIFDELKGDKLDDLISALETQLDIPIARWLEDEIGRVDQAFWSIFFPLLVSWQRSIADLTTTTHSLIENQKTTK